MLNGFINLYKPRGMSSAYALNKLKRKLKKQSIGHMGTLDPLASGVLPVAIGKSTRMFDYLLDKTKLYEAVFTFGYETTTLDSEGEIINKTDLLPSISDIEGVLPKMIGDIDQIPPKYSAKCVDGKRSYELARKGVEFTLKAKRIKIYKIEIVEQLSVCEFKFKIECGGGTYIRAIARDIAYALNTYATMTALERVKSGVFELSNSVTIDNLLEMEDLSSILIKPEDAVDHQKLILNKTQAVRLYNGLVDEYDMPNGIYRVFDEDIFYGMGVIENKKLKVKAYIRQ